MAFERIRSATERARLAAPSPDVPPSAKRQDLTGAGITTRFHVGGTDLGIPVLTPGGRLLLVFGDTFEGPRAGDGDWRSPVGLYADPASVTGGLRWTGAARGVAGREGYAGQLLGYHHPGPGVPEDVVHGLPITTQLPSDVIRLGDALYLQVMGVRGLPNVQFTELYRSLDDGETWASTGCWWPGDRWNGWFQNVTLCEGDDGFVYCVSTSFSRTRGLMLSRVAVGAIERADAWEPWGWTPAEGWGWGRPPAFVLPGRFGETCLRRVDGHWLLCAFDEGNGRIDVRLLSGPTADMTTAPVGTLARNAPRDAEDHAHGLVSQLYGGYVLPGSALDDLHVVISQWFTPGPEQPYRAMQFRGDVSALAREVADDRRV